LPGGQFDYLSTVAGDTRVALRDEVRKQFKLIGRTDTIQTNVLVLKTVDPSGRRGLKVSHGTGNNHVAANAGNLSLVHVKMPDLAKALGGYYLNLPVVDETGLKDSY